MDLNVNMNAGHSETPRAATPAHRKKMDPTEQSVKENVGRVTRLFFLKNKKKEIAAEIDAICNKMEPLLEIEQTRRRKIFADTQVRPEAVKLQQSIEEEHIVRKKKEKEVMDSFQVSEDKAKIHAFLVKQKEKMEKVHEYVKIGFDIVDNLVATGQTFKDLGSVSGTAAVEAAWENFASSYTETTGIGDIHELVRGEFEYWVDLVIQCCSVDLETERLTQLEQKIEDKKSEVKLAKRSNKENLAELKNELTQLKELYQQQEHKVEKLRGQRGIGMLSALVERGTAYGGAIHELLTKGAVACSTLEGLVDGLTGGSALITLAKTVTKLSKEIDKVEDTKKNIEALNTFHKEFLESENPCGILAAGLVSNMLSMKTLHLKRSAEISKSEIAFAALNLLSATVATGKLGIALGAVLTSTIVATPGLNAAAAVIAAVTSTGTKAKKLYNMLKNDREGVKLDVQIQEKKAQIYASAGKFYAEATRFEAVRGELESVLYKDADLRSTIQSFRDTKLERLPSQIDGKDVVGPVDEAVEGVEEFFETVEEGLQIELAPISVRKLELVESYDLTQENLYRMSLVLDQIIFRKSELQDDRSIETMSHEFLQVKKSDILVQYNLFESSLEDVATKAELVAWLTEEEIPITGDYVFESVLRFIRDDKAMPKNAVQIEEVETPVTVHIP